MPSRPASACSPRSARHEGILPNLPLRENIAVASLRAPARRRSAWSARPAERRRRGEARPTFGVVAASLEAPIRTLSGGNQQKALLARWHLADADVFVLIEPTRGVDVGARADIYRRLDALARAGKAIVVVSSDLPEVLALADRILVVRDGAHRRRDGAGDARRGAAEPDGPGRGRGMTRPRPMHPRRASARRALARAPVARTPMLVAAILLVRRLRRDRRRSSARRAMPPTSCASPPRCWCSAWRWRIVVLVGGIDLSVGSVVLASATLAGIGLAEGLPPGAWRCWRRSASARRSGCSMRC